MSPEFNLSNIARKANEIEVMRWEVRDRRLQARRDKS